ncbi:mitotic phosphoprotein N' end (MPPN) family protein [Tasmannia lanceolata]|uniref:mitotic phosphoprotein N' end (MPPN) family protein n=1 Tax=Tasmannia lanceolata TaxID=3420 RepID=UPI004063CC5F
MSSTLHRTPKSGRQSLFFRDLATPVSTHRGKFISPGQAAAVSALWRENIGGTDPPPPPIFTLEDRAEFSPESGLGDYPTSPGFMSKMRTPGRDSLSPLKSRGEASTSYPVIDAVPMQQSPSSLWTPAKSGTPAKVAERGSASPVDGVVQPGALIMLPPPREVARPDLERNSLPVDNLDEEEWVTVYGFSPGDTNLVLREFEKCGIMVKHVPGPRDGNWINILYQHRFDAQKALSKNGMQINGVLIVGVKPVDPVQRQFLNEKLSTNQGFMALPLQQSGGSMAAGPLNASPRPHYLQTSDSNRRSAGAIASPAKSVVSKVMDLMFGI